MPLTCPVYSSDPLCLSRHSVSTENDGAEVSSDPTQLLGYIANVRFGSLAVIQCTSGFGQKRTFSEAYFAPSGYPPESESATLRAGYSTPSVRRRSTIA